MSISFAAVVAELDYALRRPDHNHKDYWEEIMEILLPLGVPMLREASKMDSEHPAVRANLAAIETVQKALMRVCRHACVGHTVDEAATIFGYTDLIGTEDAIELLKRLFKDYELILFGHQTN